MNRFRILVIGALAVFGTTPAQAQMTAGVICNPKSQFTNARSGPTAKETSIVDKLANNTAVKILDRVKNPEGTHEWLKVQFKHSQGGAFTTGYVYHEGVSASCGVQNASAAPIPANPAPTLAQTWVPVSANAPVLNKGAYPPVKLTRDLAPDEKPWPLCSRAGGECGYIDKQGKWIIEPRFAMAYRFSDGLAEVILRGKSGYIDRSGTWLVEPSFDSTSSFREGLLIVNFGGKRGYIDKLGKWVVEPRFEGASNFSDGLASVQLGGKHGYIDKLGKWVVEPRFEGANDFSDGLASVKLGGKYGYIDKLGKWVVEPRFEYASGFSDGLATVKLGGKYGYIDKLGKWVVEPRFEGANDFSDGFAYAKMGGKYGMVDKAGTWVVEPKYDGVSKYDELVLVTFGSRQGYVDLTGKPLTFSSEDFMMGVMEGNQKRMEEELKKKQEEIEKLKAQAAQATQQPQVSSDFQPGQGVYVCAARSTCSASILMTGGDKIKVEFTAFCDAGLLTNFLERQQEWLPRYAVKRSASECRR